MITLLGPPMDLGFHLQLPINVNKHAWNLNLNPMPTKRMSKHCKQTSKTNTKLLMGKLLMGNFFKGRFFTKLGDYLFFQFLHNVEGHPTNANIQLMITFKIWKRRLMVKIIYNNHITISMLMLVDNLEKNKHLCQTLSITKYVFSPIYSKMVY